MTKRKACCCICSALLALASMVSAITQTRAMSIVNLIDVPQLTDPQLSPDGSQLLYILAKANWKVNKRESHIYRVDADGTNTVQLTNGENGESNPRWSPDGNRVAFIAKRGEDEFRQIYLMNNFGGEARKLTGHASDVSRINWLPEGTHIYFIAPDAKSDAERKRDEVKDDVFAFDENFKQLHIWKVSLDGVEERITFGEFSVIGYTLSRDGQQIAHHRSLTPLLDNADEGEVWLMGADGSGSIKLTDNAVSERGAELSPDGTHVLFTSDSNSVFETYYNDNIFLVPAGGGKHKMLLPDMPHEVQQATWSKDGKAIYFVANTGVRSQLFKVDVASEALNQLTQGDHALKGWSYVPSAGRHAIGIDRRTNAGDVHWLSEDGGAAPIQITNVFDYLELNFRLPRQEIIQWFGADGAKVEGLIYYPLNYAKGQQHPLVVQTHGGPASSDKFGFGRWSSYVHVLAEKGYFVFKPNYRGSTGYGDNVLRNMVGHYFNQSHLDVMTGVDHLIEKGLVDGDRMVKMGWSGGGHMTNKIITYTNRFRAASSGAGAVNWISMYGQSDVRIYRTPWFGGTPWQEDAPINTYWEHSPLKNIYNVTTPTIILVGENDVRVPPSQSVELYRALKTNGVETHLYIAPREPHGWRELRHELFKVNVELGWFERYCMGREYLWEKAPSMESKVEEEPSITVIN